MSFDLDAGAPSATGTSVPGPMLATGQGTIEPRTVALSVRQPSSGELNLTYFTSRKTETVTQIVQPTHTTAAAATPTLIRWGIYTINADNSLTLAASTPNDTTLLAATLTEYTKAFSASLALVAGTTYVLGLIVVSGATMPSYPGQAIIGAGAHYLREPKSCARLTGQTDLPASIAAGSIVSSGAGPIQTLILP
jgi:hypothetical protein